MTNLEKFIQTGKEKCEAATDGPWECLNVGDGDSLYRYVTENNNPDENEALVTVNAVDDCLDENQDFIAHSRTALPKALAIIETYEDAIGKQLAIGCNCSNENGELQTKGPTHFCYLHTARARANEIAGGE